MYMRNSMLISCAITLFLVAIPLPTTEADDAQLFEWNPLPKFPLAIEGAFVGVSDDRLIVAGGNYQNSSSELPDRQLSDVVYTLARGAEEWTQVGALDAPTAFGCSATTEFGLICIGGLQEQAASAQVILLRWDSATNSLRNTRLVDLPAPLAMSSAAHAHGRIYVAGALTDESGTSPSESVFWSAEVAAIVERRDSAWTKHSPCPGKGPFCPMVVAQSGNVYVLGGSQSPICGRGAAAAVPVADAYRFDPSATQDCWTQIADLPIAVAAASAVTTGSSSVLVMGGITTSSPIATGSTSFAINSDILAYEAITDTWTQRGAMETPAALTTAVSWQDQFVIVGGQAASGMPRSNAQVGVTQALRARFQWLDYVVLAGYLLALIAIGYYFTGGKKEAKDFLLGGQQIPWWAAGLSILATQVSSIGFMAIPAKSFATDWVYLTGSFTWFVVIPIVVRFYMPFFHQPNVTTAYEYLERRFNLLVRLYGSCAFIALQMGRMAIVLYLPAIALSVVTGMDVYMSILVMGVLSTAYTVMGGIEAVIWTDVLQAFVLMGGAILGVGIAVFGVDGGVTEFLDVAASNQKFRMVNWDMSITTTAIWVVLIGNVFQRTADLTADQTVVQRYLTTQSRQQASRALWTSVAASIPWAVIVFLFGTALFVFFKTNPEKLNPMIQTDAIVPWFIVTEMPVGIAGLMIAALFAAAMSSLDSSIHSVATTLTIDFYKRFHPNASDRSQLKLAQWLTAILGALGTAAALLAATYNIESLLDLFLKMGGLAIGGLAGLFMLGVFTKRGNSGGAIVGAATGVAVLYAVQNHTDIHFLLYSAIGIGTVFIVGYVSSCTWFSRNFSLDGLTIHTPATTATAPDENS